MFATPAILTMLLLCGAEPTTAPSPPTAASPPQTKRTTVRVLVLDLKASGVEPRIARAATSLVTLELDKQERFDVVTSDDLRRVVDLEESRQKMDCSGDTSCLAEVAGAMGAPLVLFGDISRLGDELVVNLAWFDSAKVASQGRVGFRVSGEAELADEIPRAVAQLTGAPVADEPPPDVAGVWPIAGWSLAAGGAAVSVAGLVVAVVGLVPLVGHQVALQQALALEREGSLADIDQAKTLYAQQAMWNSWWSPWGLSALLGGAAVAALAAVTAGGGVVLAVVAPDGEAE